MYNTNNTRISVLNYRKSNKNEGVPNIYNFGVLFCFGVVYGNHKATLVKGKSFGVAEADETDGHGQ